MRDDVNKKGMFVGSRTECSGYVWLKKSFVVGVTRGGEG